MRRVIALLPLLALAACGSGTDAGADSSATPDPVALVRTASAEAGATADTATLYGAVEAAPGAERTLVATSEAIVDRIVAPAGTAVRAGDPIVALKPSRATSSEIAKASADAASTGAAYARARRLRADGLASDADVETARAAAATASAAQANLGIARGGGVLRAPVGGVVQGLTAKTGDQIAAGTTLATVAIRGDLRARLGIDPALAQRVRVGQMLALDTVDGSRHAATPVVGVDSQVDQTTRLAALYAAVPRGLALGPGEAIRATLTLGAQSSGLTIPYSALMDDGGRSYVFVVRGGVAHETPVRPGSSSGDRIRILGGLAAGDEVVTQGGTALEDGMKVRSR